MKIALLSRNPQLYSTRRLVEAAEQRGHTCDVIDFLRVRMTIASDRPELYYDGRSLDDIEAIIPRVGVSATFYGCAVVRQFEMMGVYAVNPSQAIS